jgi:hypothetical protein
MLRIPLFSPDTNLLLSPRWGTFSIAAGQAGVWLLVCLIPLVLTGWLYRYELHLVRHSVALGLLAIRMVAIALLLFVICLQPAVVSVTSEELPGRVLIAVDRSQSMDIADPQRPAVDKLRLARALKLARDLCDDVQLDDWIGQYETQGGPPWVAPDEYANDPERRRQLTEERRRAHDQICQRIDSLTRSEVSRLVLSQEGAALLQALQARHHIELLGFAQQSWDMKAEEIEQPFRDSSNPATTDKTRANTAFTDLARPLIHALEHVGSDQGKLLGVVLLTDGQHNWGLSPVRKALEMGEQKLPIYPIALGARHAPPDVSVIAVKAPSTVFKDMDVSVEARIKVTGLPAQEVVVELQRQGQPPLEERVRHDGSDRYYTVPFQLRLDQVGTQALLVTAKPVPGETRTDNNSRPVVVNVADDKAKVLLVDGEARWEYHYLANALLRDRTVQMQSVIFNQPRLDKVAEEELQKTGHPRRTMPVGADALADYDCIILGDVSPADLPLAERTRLEKYVADRGGTLVVVAGKRFMPLAYLDTDDNPRASADPLPKLLPIAAPRAIQRPQGFSITRAHEGKLTPFLQFESSPSKNDTAWTELPRHYWGVCGLVKPAATSLAYFESDMGTPANHDPGALEREQALIARQNYGFGRVLFVGLDSTWRWRYKVGDSLHHRFWGQIVRWAAADKPLVTGNEYVRFGTREAVYQPGQEVDLVVRLGEEVSRLRPEALAGARLLSRRAGSNMSAPEETAALVPLQSREAQPRVLEGKIRDLTPGQYAIELNIPELADKLLGAPGTDGKRTPLRASFTVLPPESDEMVELATNWPLLEELAAKSGGKVFTPEDATDLADLLARQMLVRQYQSEHRLWQWWVTLVLALFLLTVEWVGRKWVGLP